MEGSHAVGVPTVPTGEFEERSVGAPDGTSTVSFLSRFTPALLLGRMALERWRRKPTLMNRIPEEVKFSF